MNAILREGGDSVETTFHAFNGRDQDRLTIVRAGDAITAFRAVAPGASYAFRSRRDEESTGLSIDAAPVPAPEIASVVAGVLEALFSADPDTTSIELDLAGDDPLARELMASGIARPAERTIVVEAASFWQLRDLWLRGARRAADAYPFGYVMTDGKRHPRRPPKPQGEVYARHIPWLGQTISFRTVDLAADLDVFNRWMNDPRVSYFWNEDGDLDHHRKYLQGLAADPHMLTLIGSFDGTPFGYFEIYWARENRLAPFYDVQDYDRGWHVVVGEDAFRGRPYLTAWLPSLMHFMFLDDCRTMRIVGEPRADHQQQIRNLERSGFANVKTFDFPHKRATLVMLLRERFFSERLWVPATSGPEGFAKS